MEADNMGEGKDQMELDSVDPESIRQASSSPRASFGVHRDALQMPMPTAAADAMGGLHNNSNSNNDGDEDMLPPPTPPHFNMPPPPPPCEPQEPPRRPFSGDMMMERRASQQQAFSDLEQHQKRPSLLYIDREGLYSLPERSALAEECSSSNNFNNRSSIMGQLHQQHFSTQVTPRDRPKRDSGLVSQQPAISETEPYSPASVVSSSGDQHLDRDAMLARAYQDKQSSQVKAWEKHRITKNFNKYESDIARITAWESSQVAKAEALMRRSEEEMEKRRAKLREGFKNEIATIHRRADDWKALAETRRVEEILRVQEGAARFRATGQAPKKPLLHIQSLRDMCCAFTLPYKR